MKYWHQLLNTENFEMYDYGDAGNLQHYNQTKPPVYNLSDINVPVYLHAGAYDELADPTDVDRLNFELSESTTVEYNTYPYGHLTFVLATDTQFVDKVLGALKKKDEVVVEDMQGFLE